MSVYLPTYRNNAGKITRTAKHWISFTDHQQIRRKLPAFTDRRQSEALERRIESLVAARVAREPATPEQETFIAGLPQAMLKKLVRWDILPGTKLETARPLREHMADYISALKAQGCANSHCDNCRRFLERMARECGWTRFIDITPDSIVRWRDNLQVKIPGGRHVVATIHKPASARTKNAYIKAARSFINWLVRQGSIGSNPLKHVASVEQRGREQRIRRAFTDDEVSRLLEASGPYAIVYLAALTTGLRRGELTALRWADVHLQAAKPFITVRAGISKNHKEAMMFLRHDVADALRAAPGNDAEPVFKMPGRKRFKAHLKAAGIEPVDKIGRVVDFHALRHTFITGLQRGGVAPRVAMELARHSHMELTARVYTDATMLATADAVDALPAWRPWPPATASESALATGTDNLPATTMPVESGKKNLDAHLDAEGGKRRILPDLAGQSAVGDASGESEENAGLSRVFSPSEKSGRQDLNLRPLDPQSSALARLRYAPI